MFDIRFITGEPVYRDQDGRSGLWGAIVLGDFTERFVAPLGWWTEADYQRQWAEGARRLIDGASESAFVEAAGRLWWTAWREGDVVYVQQQLILADPAMSPAWSAGPGNLPYDLVGRRSSETDDGQAVSTWVLTVADLREFIARVTSSGRG